MKQPFVNCQCFGFEGRRCARRQKVRLKELDEITSKELEPQEKRRPHIVRVVCLLALVYF